MAIPAKKSDSDSTPRKEQAPVLWFEEFGIADVSIVGGKNASLGEMIRHLVSKGIRIPNGFATTARASRRFLEFNGLDVKLSKLFTGQHETYLNVHGVKGLLEACKKCFASIFTDRAFYYRQTHGFDHLSIALSIGVQKMVRSDLACSGVMFSVDTETGFTNAVLINGSYGLGENIVQGVVNPDEFMVFKPTLKQGFRPILSKIVGTKESKLIYDMGGSKSTKNIPVPPSERKKLVLSDPEILELSRWACVIEDHYSQVNGAYTPMDMEWAKDGITGQLFIVQARPETVQSRKKKLVLRTYRLEAA